MRLDLEPQSIYRARRDGEDSHGWDRVCELLATVSDEVRALRLLLTAKDGTEIPLYPRPQTPVTAQEPTAEEAFQALSQII